MKTEGVYQLFPSLVWKFKVDSPLGLESFNRDVEKKILKLKYDPKVVQSPQDKWYSPRDLHKREGFEEIKNKIIEASEAVLKSGKIEAKNGIKITGCWANISSPGADHHKHSHPNNYLSGVYYVKSEPGGNSIKFHDPRPQVGLIRPPFSGSSLMTSESVNLMVEEGDLVIFPHWLMHSVEKNKSDTERISIAFNVMFNDYVETMSPPMW